MGGGRADRHWLLTLLMWELAVVFFLTPAGRFRFGIAGTGVSIGYDVYKNFAVPLVTWLAWRRAAGRGDWPRFPMLAPMAAFFLAGLCASIASSDPYQSLTECLEIGLCILFAVMLIDLPWDEGMLKTVCGAFALGVFYLAAVAAYQGFLLDGGAAARANATLDFPNALGAFCLLALPLLYWIGHMAKDDPRRNLLALAAAGAVTALLLSRSRAAFLGLLAGAGVYWWMAEAAWRGRLKYAAEAAGLLGAALLLPRFLYLQQEFDPANEMSRLLIWPFVMDYGVPALSRSFFGLGLGPVIEERLADWIAGGGAAEGLPRPWHTHSLYLYVFLGTGVPGALAFAWMIAAFFQSLRAAPPGVRAAFAAGLAGFGVHQIFETHLLVGNIPVLYFTLFAIASRRASRRAGRAEP